MEDNDSEDDVAPEGGDETVEKNTPSKQASAPPKEDAPKEVEKEVAPANEDEEEQMMVQPDGTLAGSTFLHSNCSKKQAERLLLHGNGRKADGKFLIRQREDAEVKGAQKEPQTYIFSVMHKQKVNHHVRFFLQLFRGNWARRSAVRSHLCMFILAVNTGFV